MQSNARNEKHPSEHRTKFSVSKMSRHRYSGLLVSQLLEFLGTPLSEEQVWGLCYEICKSLVDTSSKATSEDEDGSLRSHTHVLLELDTVYLRKEGSIVFVLHGNYSSDAVKQHAVDFSSSQQMKNFGKLLSTFYGLNTVHSKLSFEKLPVGEDLKDLIRHLVQGRWLKDTQAHWVHFVSDCCVRHASLSSRTVGLPSEYYRRLCKALANEALEMNKFLEVLKNAFVLMRSHDALCTLELFQARPTVRCWLRVMSEVREGNTRDLAVVDSQTFSGGKSWAQNRGVSDIYSSSISPKLTRRCLGTKTGDEPNLTETAIHLCKPILSSTPSASCKPSRKVLRPPQRLVDQVTSWMLDVEAWQPNYYNRTSSCASAKSCRNLTRGEWTELDSHGSERDVSWSGWRQQSSAASSSEDWFQEIARIRRVLTELELDSFMDQNESSFDALREGKICFCCRHTKFTLFNRWGVVCDVCQKKVCASCFVQAKPRDLGMTSSDATPEAHRRRGDAVLKQIRRVFSPKPAGGRGETDDDDNNVKVCKDCRDFVQRFY